MLNEGVYQLFDLVFDTLSAATETQQLAQSEKCTIVKSNLTLNMKVRKLPQSHIIAV